MAATDFRDPPILNALNLLRLFPKLPARYFNTVLTHALSSKKSVNKPARALLLGIDGIEQRLLPFLSDSKQDVRSGVAEMLGAIGAEGAIEPLKKALGKEKSELVRAAVLGALRRLRVDVSSYVSPEILLKEATNGLKGKKAKDIGWFPLDTLPALNWASGGAVPSDVPRWWIALSRKARATGRQRPVRALARSARARKCRGPRSSHPRQFPALRCNALLRRRSKCLRQGQCPAALRDVSGLCQALGQRVLPRLYV